MKNKKLRIVLASIVSVLAICGIVAYIFCCLNFTSIDSKVVWISAIIAIFLFQIICSLIIFNGKKYSDEIKAFWLFTVIFIIVVGAIFWLFIGREKQNTYCTGKSNQSTILSHLFKAKKSIKIYTNSLFLSLDVIKCLNYESWKDVKIEIVVCFDQKKWKNKILKYDINKNFESKINVYFTDKTIEHHFIIIDGKEVLFSTKNFNFKNMHNDTKTYLAQDINGYISLWNRDFIRSSKFEIDKNKPAWYKRLNNGIVNIFYPFF